MITVLVGENTFERERTLQKIAASFSGEVEKIDGNALTIAQLPNIMMGVTLFSQSRLVIIRHLQENTTVWAALPNFTTRTTDDVHVVFIEDKLDKRTKTYKTLQKQATIQEFAAWTERDTKKAEQWTMSEAKQLNIVLSPKEAGYLVARVGVDQWALFRALEKLQFVTAVTIEVIDQYIEKTPSENVFLLFETALKGNTAVLHNMIRNLELTDDAYRLFGLLSGQAFQLVALHVSDASASQVAKDFGVHPFALQKLESYARRLSTSEVKDIIAAFADADAQMKSTSVNPWIATEQALLKVANIVA